MVNWNIKYKCAIDEEDFNMIQDGQYGLFMV
jgi:hypothetical protein